MTETSIQHVSTSKLSCKLFIDRYFVPLVPLAQPMVPLAPLALPMVPLAAETVQGSLVTNGTIGVNGKITNGTIGRTPNIAIADHWLPILQTTQHVGKITNMGK